MLNLSTIGCTQRFYDEATRYPQYILARIKSQYKGSYRIVTDKGESVAVLSGKFRHETTCLYDYPAVGDYVMVMPPEGTGQAVIHQILKRKSVFARKAVGIAEQTQVIAANIDIVFLCKSLNNNYNLSRLERYLSVAWDSGATPVVILTKADLCKNLSAALAEISEVAIATDILPVSVYDCETVAKLIPYLKSGITASFIGSSGVGKSTLINKLLGEDAIATNAIGKEDKGRHTTTGREMFVLPTGAIVIDTPGMRELGIEAADLGKTFGDIEELVSQCRFADCTHTAEPGCAVREAIQKGELDGRRLQNYLKIKREARYSGLSAKEIETEKLDTMFRDLGGMKKRKNYKNLKKQDF
ncbi:MAG: ribosome small subunit-dependent GTPase A [Candidatus Moranbacteria bacterium]|nr:ribosome small subunit-dependent GTPase A [Candidatus Moranbacteria bacterium]